MGASQFFNAFRSVFNQLEETQLETISKVAKWGAGAIAADRLIVLFGSGHSFIATMDTYPRIGSYPGWLPIHELSTSYMPTILGNHALRQALSLEKVEGFGRVSTIAACIIMQSLVAEVAQNLDEQGIRLPVFPSHNAGMTPEQRAAIDALADAWYVEHARRTAGIYK